MRSDIGVNAVVLVDGKDVGQYLRSVRWSSLLAAVQDTKFRPPGYSHTFVAGLQGGAVSFAGDPPADEVGAVPDLPARGVRDIFIAPYGDTPGNLAIIGKALHSQFAVDTPTDGLIGFNADLEITAGSPGVMFGQSLWAARGSDSFSANEVQTLTFSDVPALQQFAFRKTGGVTLSTVWRASDSNATLKARIEELYDGTATVTGSLTTDTDTDTGETLYSGALTVTFSGDDAGENVPQLEVISGEVQALELDGEALSGTWNGATVEVEDSAATVQSALRATGGDWASVVVAGSSS